MRKNNFMMRFHWNQKIRNRFFFIENQKRLTMPAFSMNFISVVCGYWKKILRAFVLSNCPWKTDASRFCKAYFNWQKNKNIMKMWNRFSHFAIHKHNKCWRFLNPNTGSNHPDGPWPNTVLRMLLESSSCSTLSALIAFSRLNNK